jgi:TRAP-type C4-dicarboxylate transport system permease large subunit
LSASGRAGFVSELAGQPGLLNRSLHKSGEEGVGAVRAGLEFWVVLDPDHPRVVLDLDDLDQAALGVGTPDDQAGGLELGPVGVVIFEAMAVAFLDIVRAVGGAGAAAAVTSAGWATPTECAALGAFATMVLAAFYKALNWDAVLKSLKGTAGISGMILFIILGATTFAQILSFSGASTGLVQFITGQGLSTAWIVVGMMLILIFLGIFVDQVSMMMITLPIFMPIVTSLGIDPIWFGVMFLICMQLGLLLPPHGLLLMTMRGVAPPSVTMAHIFLAVGPYVVMSLILLLAVFFIPGIATWLPGWIG